MSMEGGRRLSIRCRMVYAGRVARAKRSKSEREARLSAADWEAAALDALARSGVGGVAVEPLARQLGVTKGSFYWHFADRDALLAAALRRWEDSYTERIIAGLAALSDPRARLVRLIGTVSAGGRAERIHIALATAAHDPLVRDALARATHRRLTYLQACYVDLGQPRREAKKSALLAYAAYIGMIHLRLEAPRAMPGGRSLADYVDYLTATLVP
jgi:AcrR family transcriptional regulator